MAYKKLSNFEDQDTLSKIKEILTFIEGILPEELPEADLGNELD